MKGELVPAVLAARSASETLRAEVRLSRAFQERCGDIIGALFAAAGAERDLADAVAEGQRRHREGARLTVTRIVELRGLREGVGPGQAQALIALSTAHAAWRELVDGHGLTWDDAEAWLADALGHALLAAPLAEHEAHPETSASPPLPRHVT